jgi:hypothetical protein
MILEWIIGKWEGVGWIHLPHVKMETNLRFPESGGGGGGKSLD